MTEKTTCPSASASASAAAPSSSSSSSSSSSCPVMSGSSSPSASTANEASTGFMPLFSWNKNNNSSIVDSASAATAAAAAAEPSAAASLEEAARYAQTPHPDQKFHLDTRRQVSSIPRGGSSIIAGAGAAVAAGSNSSSGCPVVRKKQEESCGSAQEREDASAAAAASAAAVPHHQHDLQQNRWVYPSEQQMYNAMRRKGWQNIPEDSVPTVLQIHNHINERTWQHIREWECIGRSNSSSNSSTGNTANDVMTTTTGMRDDDCHDVEQLKLVKFHGRPKDWSPKAYFWSKVLRLRDAPFDRHDWYVENSETNTVQRYVIDYYMLQQQRGQHGGQELDDNKKNDLSLPPPIPYIDARPALDHPRAVWLRCRYFARQAFPGIASALDRQQSLKQQQQQQQQQQQNQQQHG